MKKVSYDSVTMEHPPLREEIPAGSNDQGCCRCRRCTGLVLIAGKFALISGVLIMVLFGITVMTKMKPQYQRDKPHVEILGKVHKRTPSNATSSRSKKFSLSTRGQAIRPTRDDIKLFMQAAADPYHPVNNTDGYFVMLVAENRLMYPELSARLQQIMSQQQEVLIPEWVFDYGDMTGQVQLKQAIADMMESSWIDAPVDAQYLVLLSGAGAVLDCLAWTLADASDGVLVTAPAYPAFAADVNVHGGLQLHTAMTQAVNNYEPTVEELEHAYASAVAADLHVVSDEIYGNSVFPGVHVTSAAQIMHEMNNGVNNSYLGDHVHIVAGLSKDWGMSGFRVGSLFTHNNELLQAMSIVSYYCAVSEYTQFALTALLQDKKWTHWYLAENKRRLQSTFQAMEKALALIGVPVFPSTAGLFAWADFSSLLQTNQTEKDLWLELFHNAKVLFTTGESCYGEKPGTFRVVYPWPEGGVIAMKALGERLVAWKSKRKPNRLL